MHKPVPIYFLNNNYVTCSYKSKPRSYPKDRIELSTWIRKNSPLIHTLFIYLDDVPLLEYKYLAHLRVLYLRLIRLVKETGQEHKM